MQLQMRISQISLEDNGVVAFNIQKRNRNFTKMLSFIFFRYLIQYKMSINFNNAFLIFFVNLMDKMLYNPSNTNLYFNRSINH